MNKTVLEAARTNSHAVPRLAQNRLRSCILMRYAYNMHSATDPETTITGPAAEDSCISNATRIDIECPSRGLDSMMMAEEAKVEMLVDIHKSCLIHIACPDAKHELMNTIRQLSTVSNGTAWAFADESASWSAVRSHLHNFAMTRMDAHVSKRVFVLDAFDMYCACDRSCLNDMRSALDKLGGRATVMMLTYTPITTKVARSFPGIATFALTQTGNMWRLDQQNMADFRDSGANADIQRIFSGTPQLADVEDMVCNNGAHMFVDTLQHNAAHVLSSEAYLQRSILSSCISVPSFCQSTPDNSARICMNVVRACIWRNVLSHTGHSKTRQVWAFTNELSLCNARACARKKRNARACQERKTVAEIVWEDPPNFPAP